MARGKDPKQDPNRAADRGQRTASSKKGDAADRMEARKRREADETRSRIAEGRRN